MRKIIIIILVISTTLSQAQIGVGTNSPDATLDIRATNSVAPENTDGILIPRIDNFPTTNPTVSQNGMLVFLTTAVTDHPVGFYYWNDTYALWKKVDTGNVKYWEQSGNSGTTEGTDFIGTTDAQDLDIRINNTIHTRITQKGQIETLNTGQSVFIGERAGAQNDNFSASKNTFVGYYAGENNTHYSNNTANGYKTLYNNQHEFNTASGYNALNTNSGSYNTAIGYEAIYDNRDTNGANYNTAFGNRVFYYSHANYNTGVGYRGGNFAAAIQDYTIFLGDIRPPVSVSFNTNIIAVGNNIVPYNRNNYLTIGHTIFGYDLAEVGYPFSRGNIGVSIMNPKEKLDVDGAIKLGSTTNTQAGTIRWSGTDFEGYDGTSWLSLTKKNSFWNNEVNGGAEENQVITASDGVSGDYFGYAVAICGDYAIIGAFSDDIGGNTNQGSAYIFKRTGSTWTEETKITASDGAASDYFGHAVAISGDYVIIGAYLDDVSASNQGSAYIFKRDGTAWNEEAKILADDPSSNDRFGISVSIDGEYALIGAYLDRINGNTYQGSAYVFKRTGTSWNQESKLIASDGAEGDQFGHSVAISGDYTIVGAFQDDIVANTNQGSAYVFKRSGTYWNQEAKLLASDGAALDYFADSVSIHDTYAIIGAPKDDVGSNTDQGSSYIFKREGITWSQEEQITASDGMEYDNFGMSVSIYNNYVIVGAYRDDIGTNSDQGAAYIFKKYDTQWGEKTKLTAFDGIADAYFGYSVSIYGDYAIIGAYGNEKAYFINK